jgi:hypothetical protein
VKHPEDFDPFVHDPIRQDIRKSRHPQLMDTIGAVGWMPEIGVIDQVRGAMNNALHEARRHILARDGKDRQEVALRKGEPDDSHDRVVGSLDVGLRQGGLIVGAELVRPGHHRLMRQEDPLVDLLHGFVQLLGTPGISLDVIGKRLRRQIGFRTFAGTAQILELLLEFLGTRTDRTDETMTFRAGVDICSKCIQLVLVKLQGFPNNRPLAEFENSLLSPQGLGSLS